MKSKLTFKEGDKVLLKTVKLKNSLTWEAGKYIVTKVSLGKSIRYAIEHKKNKGSFLFINQKDTIKKAKLVS